MGTSGFFSALGLGGGEIGLVAERGRLAVALGLAAGVVIYFCKDEGVFGEAFVPTALAWDLGIGDGSAILTGVFEVSSTFLRLCSRCSLDWGSCEKMQHVISHLDPAGQVTLPNGLKDGTEGHISKCEGRCLLNVVLSRGCLPA